MKPIFINRVLFRRSSHTLQHCASSHNFAKTCFLPCIFGKKFSTLPNEQIVNSFRCSETNPCLHNENHLGQFYQVPKDIMNKLFILGGFNKLQHDMMKAVCENCIMVRQPALEVMSYLKKADYTMPVIRYILCKYIVYC